MSNSNSSKRHWQIAIISLLIMVSLTGCTSKKEAREEYLDYAITNICSAFKDALFNTSCKTLIFFQSDTIKHLIDINTSETNFVIFTVYNTSFLGVEVKTVSFLGNHLTLPVSD